MQQVKKMMKWVVLAGLLCGYTATTWAVFSATWSQKQSVANPPSGPGARGWVQLPYDSVAQRLVLIGGSGEHYYNDVWQYAVGSDTWTQLEAYVPCESINGFTPPTPRDEHAVVFDSYNNLLWMYGGSGFGCKGEVRTAGTGTSSQQIVDPTLTASEVDFYKNWGVFIPQSPYPYAFVTLYDPLMHVLTLNTPLTGLTVGWPYQLFPQGGGGTWSYSPASRAWTGYDAPQWPYAGISPQGRLSPALAYSMTDHALVLFGGESNGAVRNDTWVWDVVAKIWQQARGMNDPASPPGRAQVSNAMVYDSFNDVFILFGGRCYSAGSCPRGDTWTYKLATNTWTQMNPSVSPAPREQQQMAYDVENHVVVLYGGAGAGGIFDDLWVYNYQTNQWQQVVPNSVNRPGPRKTGTLGYDPVNKLFVLYGGDGGSSSYDIWALKLTQNGAGNVPPTAIASVNPTSGNTNTAFQFDASSSSDSDGSIASYFWNFGDGATATAISPTHQYAATGIYNATLTVADNQGATGVVSLAVTVNAVASGEVSWVDDAAPAGATLEGAAEGWRWISANPTPFSGSLAHQSALVGGMHQHYFYNAPIANQLSVNPGDTLFAYVFLDPDNPPSEIMLQWNDGTGAGWGFRAYWGANQISWGVDGTISRRHMGALPPVGQWVRLEVPASLVGLEGHSLSGMAFTLFNGRATWDRAGKVGVGGGNTPPSVNIAAPANNASYTAPASIIIDVNATDSDGSITQVEFYNGATLLDTDTSAPYSFTWSNVAAGNYSLTAKAYDNSGANTTSSVINVIVNTPQAPPQLSVSDSMVSGSVTPATSSVTLNGAPLILNNGTFSFSLPLTLGTNVYNLQASNAAGVAGKRITVTVE